MVPSLSVLKDSHKHNLSQVSNTTNPWTIRVKHSLTSDLKPKPQTLGPVDNAVSGKNSLPSINLSIPKTLMEGIKEIGPSLKHPVISSTYFTSAIRTLKESMMDPAHDCISIHDLVEAYNMLSNKIRAHIHLVASADKPPLFLTIFKEESSHMVGCLTRDIRRILPSAFDSQPHSHSFADLSYNYEATQNEEDFRIVAENNTLCQYALRFVSDVFTFPALYSNFSDNQLASLLRDVVSLCATTVPPFLNLPKSSAMAVWTLKVQQLPISILLSLKVEIMSALRNSISHQAGGYVGKLDAFKAIHCILETHPNLSVSFIGLLPVVLDHLNTASPEIQLHASLALSGFTSAKMKLDSKDQFPREQASKFVQTYIDAHRTQNEFDNPLLSSFKAALADGSQWRRLGPSFALATISCFLVLLDHFFFTSPRSVKFVITVLQDCARHKAVTVRDTQAEIWKILFWVFSRIPLVFDRDSPSGKPGVRKCAYGLVCEDLRGGRRFSLLGSLLGADNFDTESGRSELDVSRAIDLVVELVETGDSTSRNGGVAILSRLMAGIGTPTTGRDVDGDQVSFSRNLIDGTLLSQNVREIGVPAVKVTIEQLPPLSEKEVIRHWEKLSKLWVTVAQHVLPSGQEFSPNIFQAWQALLLVHGNLAPGEQHLSASPSFAPRVASIVTGLSMASDTTEMQRRYLGFIWKLWVVMKNVFTTTSLSSPAEMILASLLKKQFTLADDYIRDLWSQICGDLISVGIPTLLHVLRRRSESQEETEVTRQLWLVLAENGPLVTGDDHWDDLLQFLVMPFGVWELSSDFDIWIGIFRRAIDSGRKASQTQNDVISRFLSLLKGDKLASLKHSSRILHWLLVQTPSCSHPNAELLSLIDDSVFSAYGATVEKKAYALDTLRLIGEFISKTEGSDLLQLLSILQKSLSCWIADEKKELDDHEDKELVDILYKPSLEILAKIEPSIEILKSIATFIQSAFVRIRGDGPLAFNKFWHATYHTRPDIPRSDYPLPIQQCLKAWGDITDGSLAEGISLDSGSESLRSYTIPDSQPSQETISGDVDLDFDISHVDHAQPVYVVAYDYVEGSSSDGAATPISKSRITRSRGKDLQHPAALAALHDYASNYDRGSLDIFGQEDNTSKFHDFSALMSNKRSAGSDHSRTPKRARTDESGLDFRPRASKDRTRGPDISGRPSGLTASVSEPVTRTSSLAALPPKSTSQPSQARPRRKSNETPSWLGSDLRKLQIPTTDYDQEPSTPEQIAAKMSSDDYDYDSWELGVSAEDLRHVQAELQDQSSFIMLDSEDNPGIDADNLDQRQSTEHYDSDNQDVLSPSLGEYPPRSRRRHRSQTAPEPSNASRSLSGPQPLRRNQTTPLDHKKGSSAQLDALQRAYAIVADTGTSQIDAQDIMHARRLANQINQVLDEQMCLKFGASKQIPGDS